MPYCPKCDMEFIEGITVCSDCGGPLYESEEAYKAIEKEETAKRLAEQAAQMEAFQALMEAESDEDSITLRNQKIWQKNPMCILASILMLPKNMMT